eukprot:scaffold103133_cov63-Phaeocystis_antarctica.AAC.1
MSVTCLSRHMVRWLPSVPQTASFAWWQQPAPRRPPPPHECISSHAQPHLSPGVLASVLPPDPNPTLTKMCTPPQASTRVRGGFPQLEGA